MKKSKNIKIFILTEGGKNIGFGHITRDVSLSQAFKKMGITPEFIVNGDSMVKNQLKGERYQIFDWLKKKERLFNTTDGAHMAIIDSYKADSNLYGRVSGAVKHAIYIDDTNRLDYPRGTVVNGMIYAGALNYKKKREITYLLGVKYAVLRKEFRNVSKRNIKANPRSVMVTFGGDDKRGMTPKILKFLKKKYPKLKKNVIVGAAFRDKKRIRALKDANAKLVYNPNAGKMKEIMMGSDFAISAGGQTLHELARSGVPALGICIAENQKMNLEGWQKTGFLEYLGWYDRKDLLPKLEKAISAIFPAGERKKRSRIGMDFVDGKGAERVVDTLLRLGCKRRHTQSVKA